MDAAVAVQLVKECAEEDAPVATLIGDDDSSTMAHISKEVSFPSPSKVTSTT